MPRKEKPFWRPDEPAREKAYQRLYKHLETLDTACANLFRLVGKLEARMDELEKKKWNNR